MVRQVKIGSSWCAYFKYVFSFAQNIAYIKIEGNIDTLDLMFILQSLPKYFPVVVKAYNKHYYSD